MRKIIYLFFMSTFCTLMMTSCLKNDTDTIVLPEIVLTEEVPNSVIPDAIRAEFETHMPIYEGNNPPFIQGQYVMNQMVLSYNSVGDFETGHVFADCYMAFLNQVKGSCSYAEKQASTTGSAGQVYITGSGNDFTAYFVANSEYGDGVTRSTASTLVSGTITSEGITNCKYAFILLSKEDPNSELMPVNGYRVFYDNTYLASRQAWYSGSNKAPQRSAEMIEMSGLAKMKK